MCMLAEVDWNTFMMNTDFVALIIMLGMIILAITGVALWYWSKVRIAEAEVGLKERMVERGFSADEIERVLGASSATCRSRERHVRAQIETSP